MTKFGKFLVTTSIFIVGCFFAIGIFLSREDKVLKERMQVETNFILSISSKWSMSILEQLMSRDDIDFDYKRYENEIRTGKGLGKLKYCNNVMAMYARASHPSPYNDIEITKIQCYFVGGSAYMIFGMRPKEVSNDIVYFEVLKNA